MNPVIFFLFISALAGFPFLGLAQDVVNQQADFNIEPAQDLYQRTEISAILIKVSLTAYWYVDKTWCQGLAANGHSYTEQR